MVELVGVANSEYEDWRMKKVLYEWKIYLIKEIGIEDTNIENKNWVEPWAESPIEWWAYAKPLAEEGDRIWKNVRNKCLGAKSMDL